MKWFQTSVVAVISIIVLALAVEFFQSTTFSLFHLNITSCLELIMVIVYLLGMLTGVSMMSLFICSVSFQTQITDI